MSLDGASGEMGLRNADVEAVFRLATEAEQVANVMDLTADDAEGAEELLMDAVPPQFQMPGILNRSEDNAVEETELASCSSLPRASFSSKTGSISASFLHGQGAECCICCAELPSDTVCMLMRKSGKKRSCRHYLHHACVKLLMQSTPAPYLCPLCRTEFIHIEPLPDVRLNSSAWFRAIDDDGSGALEKCEVIDALCATLPVDPEKLEKVELWSQWDVEGTGHITREAFEHPRGMLQFVLYSLPSLKREVRSGAIPDVEQNRESWFRYWDEDNQRELEFPLCLRALARTLRIDGDCADMSLLRKVLIQLFVDFGLCEEMNMDYSTGAWSVQGIESRPLTRKLFCERPDGFCDRLLDQLKQEFGRSRFCQLQERARLLQLPVAELKRRLPRNAPVPLEKGELVEAILAAPANCARPPKAEAFEEPQSRQWHAAGLTQQEVQALPLAELQRRLRSVGVSYDHCLERRELEELLLAQRSPSGATEGDPTPQRCDRCFAQCSLHWLYTSLIAAEGLSVRTSISQTCSTAAHPLVPRRHVCLGC